MAGFELCLSSFVCSCLLSLLTTLFLCLLQGLNSPPPHLTLSAHFNFLHINRV
ncbi:hypothetical protein BDR06DRAFT_965571 [Suillus hirtellus]|nr:hypothetical protein BDR06DRAFT_965571 [Suillus hirtellus]